MSESADLFADTAFETPVRCAIDLVYNSDLSAERWSYADADRLEIPLRHGMAEPRAL